MVREMLEIYAAKAQRTSGARRVNQLNSYAFDSCQRRQNMRWRQYSSQER
jgi:hypothetical protein